MIVDHIRNRELYYYLGEDFKAALIFFANITDAPFERDDIHVPNSGVVVKARPMMTKPVGECSFESHKKYADIHFVAYGREKIGYADVQKLNMVEYSEEKDAALLLGEGDLITLLPGYFMITMPDDAHMPCVCVEAPETLGKMIAKIKIQ